MSRFQGILLPSFSKTATPKEIQTEVRKSLLDSLKNDNTVYDELSIIFASTALGSIQQFPDGTIFQRGITSQSIAITTAIGSGFFGQSGAILFPKPFKTIQSFGVFGRGGIWCSNGVPTLISFSFYANYWTSTAASSRDYDWFAIGT